MKFKKRVHFHMETLLAWVQIYKMFGSEPSALFVMWIWSFFGVLPPWNRITFEVVKSSFITKWANTLKYDVRVRQFLWKYDEIIHHLSCPSTPAHHVSCWKILIYARTYMSKSFYETITSWFYSCALFWNGKRIVCKLENLVDVRLAIRNDWQEVER